MKNRERLEYLKNIKSKELKNKFGAIKTQGNSKDEEECEKITRDIRMVEEEIYDLEYKISNGYGEEEFDELDDPNMRERIKNTYPYEYIDDYEFIKVNYKKVFSIEDQIALIIHSRVQPLDKKIADLEIILNENKDNKYCKSIRAWINYNKKKIDYVNNICNGKELFSVLARYSNTGEYYVRILIVWKNV